MENTTINTQNSFTRICSTIAVALTGIVFAVLSITAMLHTCRIDPANPYAEIINFEDDFLFANIGLVALTFLAFIALVRRDIHISAVDTSFVIFIMLIVATVIPLVWVNLVQSKASGDAMIMLNTARDAAQDNYRSFHSSYDYYGNYSYYLYYPFQLGYVLFAEILYRVFGTSSTDLLFQVPNVIALDLLYVGVVFITKRVFRRKAVTNMTAIALAVCLQPMFMTTFTYGLIIGICLSVWSVYFTLRYMQENKLQYAGIAILLIALSVVMKYNNMILLAAICIALILHVIGSRRFLALAVAALMVVCSVGAQKLVIYSYSQRSGAELNTQVSQKLYAYMGISDSGMAPGWYNGIAMETLRDNKMDVEAADRVAEDGISRRLEYLSDNKLLGDFLWKKFTSQFNEPSFESVWVSQVREHNIPEGEKLSDLVTSVYTGGLSTLLDNWFNYYNMIIYIGFAAGMAWLIIRRKATSETVILPAAVFGAVLYHMIFEGKSQYLLPYFVLLIPYAMYGLLESTQALRRKTDFLFKSNKE